MLWLVVIAVVMWILQCVLGLWQFKRFNRHFKALRAEGRVAIGKAKGKIVAGSVVLLCIDRNCKIVKGAKMQGLTIFAGVKPFMDLNGLDLTEIGEGHCTKLDKQTKKAVLNAVENYRAFEKQEETKKLESLPVDQAINS